MPENYSRIEVHLPSPLVDQLYRLQAEIEEETGRKPTRNKLLTEIVRQFFMNPSRACKQV